MINSHFYGSLTEKKAQREPAKTPIKEAIVRTTFAQQPASTVYRCNVAREIVDMLPDAALLDI